MGIRCFVIMRPTKARTPSMNKAHYKMVAKFKAGEGLNNRLEESK